MFKKSIPLFLALNLFALSAPAAFKCATAENIKSLSDDQAIDLAYESGPKAGNFGSEALEELYGGIYFMSKANSVGNLAMLDMYPALNLEIFKFMGSSHDAKYRHNYSGIFKPTYDQNRECRRQLLITGTASGEIKNPVNGYEANGRYFTGWINVEICNPSIADLFTAGSKFYDAEGKKMDDINKFLSFIDILLGKGKITSARSNLIKESLDTKNHPDVYYAKGSNGHIAPRFSLKIKHMYFVSEDDTCAMNVIPTSSYSGVLEAEEHTFSEEKQANAYQQTQKSAKVLTTQKEIQNSKIAKDQYNSVIPLLLQDDEGPLFLMSYWIDTNTIGFRAAEINRSLNSP